MHGCTVILIPAAVYEVKQAYTLPLIYPHLDKVVFSLPRLEFPVKVFQRRLLQAFLSIHAFAKIGRTFSLLSG